MVNSVSLAFDLTRTAVTMSLSLLLWTTPTADADNNALVISVLYKNTKAGDLLTKSHPDTFKAMPDWNKMFKSLLEGLDKKIKMIEPGEKSGV